MKTKVRNAPKKIYLNLGDDMGIEKKVDFGAFSEVTWCQDKISDNDIEYYLNEPQFQSSAESPVLPEITDSLVEVENFAEFLTKGEIDLIDGDYYWHDDSDGDYPMDHKQVVKAWLHFENQPPKELDELDDILIDNKEYD